jgi:hypothetical protein
VGLYASGSSPVVVDVDISDDVKVDSVRVTLVAIPRPGDDDVPPDEATAQASLVSGTPQEGTWRATIVLDRHSVTGAWVSEVGVRDSGSNGAFAGRVFDEGYQVDPIDEFAVKRNTVIRGFNVGEPVSRGSYVRLYGRLLRLDPASGYVGYRGKTVQVLFRPAGSTTWNLKGTATTDSRGSFTRTGTFRAYRDGVWKVTFAGTDRYLPETSSGDYVDTR